MKSFARALVIAAVCLSVFGGSISAEVAVESVPELILQLSDPAAEVRIQAARALGEIGAGAEQAAPALIELFADLEVRAVHAAESALTSIGPSAIPALRDVLLDQDPDKIWIRARAAGVLGALGTEEAVDALVVGLSDPSAGVRRAAGRALERIGSDARKAVSALGAAALSDSDPDVRQAAAAALAAMARDVPEAIVYLAQVRGDLEPSVAWVASRAFMTAQVRQALTEPEAAQWLAALIRDQELPIERRVSVMEVYPNPDELFAEFLSEFLNPKILVDRRIDALKLLHSSGPALRQLADDQEMTKALENLVEDAFPLDLQFRLFAMLFDDFPAAVDLIVELAALPPIRWGDIAGTREDMVETRNRWQQYSATPLPHPEVATRSPLVPAFPGAEGFGAYAFGGRGGQVLRVTNLNDSGPGSLRAAAEAAGPRIVIFDISGTIELQSPIRVYHPYMTIAGQTAPGDGVTVAGEQFDIRTHDVILRHMRFRHGTDDFYSGDEWTLRVRGSNHVIVDHVTVTWGVDGNLGVTHSDNVTIQNSVLAKPLRDAGHEKGTRAYGALVRGRHGASYSFLSNLWANHRARVPRPGNYLSHTEDPDGLLVDFRNNVVFEGIGANYDVDTITEYNFINNYYLTNWHLIDHSTHTQGYFAGNFLRGAEPRDQWRTLVRPGANVNRDYHQQLEPFAVPPVITRSAVEAWDYVMAHAGMWIRDRHDTLVIQEVLNYHRRQIERKPEEYTLPGWWQTGLIDSQAEVGGLPELRTVVMPDWVDSNRNGLPDWWETVHQLDPGVDGLAQLDSNGNGYSNIEDYINDLAAIRITHQLANGEIGFDDAVRIWQENQ